MTKKNLLLHAPHESNALRSHYEQAFSRANELYIVSAYLTEWDVTSKLGRQCKHFRLIVGRDFGITRKHACRQVMQWLPIGKKIQFKVADGIDGFHPKAVLWKETDGRCFSIIGSSNLTKAAFERNFEANVFHQITTADFESAKQWIKKIEGLSRTVSEEWLSKYKEAPHVSASRKGKGSNEIVPLQEFILPNPSEAKWRLKERRAHLFAHKKVAPALLKLIKSCASGKIGNDKFYSSLPAYWGNEVGNRLQGFGWEILGKRSDFRELCVSYLNILRASNEDRDDVVSDEINRLKGIKVSSRGAFLSELLCLNFPSEYPILNQPVRKYIRAAKLGAPRGANEGERYVDLAEKLRLALRQNPKHPAKNLAELDTVIWLVFG
jgi:HKD family nuclease